MDHDNQTGERNADFQVDEPLTPLDAYNIVCDIGTGVNFRIKDNLLQAIAIFVCFVSGIPIGGLVGWAFFKDGLATGLFLGGGIGLLAGLFGSGIFIMFYRGWRHVKTAATGVEAP